jgi:hypothetical protein
MYSIAKRKDLKMFNAIVLSIAIILAIILAAVKPIWCAIFLFITLCFFIYKIFNGRCVLLMGKDDCELWDIYKLKEDFWWEAQKGIHEASQKKEL